MRAHKGRSGDKDGGDGQVLHRWKAKVGEGSGIQKKISLEARLEGWEGTLVWWRGDPNPLEGATLAKRVGSRGVRPGVRWKG